MGLVLFSSSFLCLGFTEICGFTLLTNFGKIAAIISSIILPTTPLPFTDFNYKSIRLLLVVSQLINALFIFYQFFFLYVSFWRVCVAVFKFTNHFSAMSYLPLIPSSVFFTFDIVVSIY